MNKLKTWLILVLILILLLGSFFYLREKITPNNIQEPIITDQQEDRPKGFATPEETKSQKKAREDIQLISEALSSQDLSACNKITSNESLKKQCEDNLNYPLIFKSQDETKCEQLHNQELKIQCHNKIYLTAAVNTKDLSLCKLITNNSLQQMCLDQVQMIESRQAKNTEVCASISSDTLKKQCEDNIQLKISTKTLSPEGCNQISDNRMASQCKAKITKNLEVIEQSRRAAQNATATKTFQEILELCNNLSGKKANTCKDAIYPQLAFDEKDLSYCNRVSNEAGQAACHKEQEGKLNEYYLRQAIASNNKALCDRISENELKEICQNT